MFEPVADVIRLRRRQLNLTQEEVAKLAGVSRRQLSLLEQGHNVSLAFLLKVTKALKMTELMIDDLRLRPAAPELGALVVAADAVAMAQQVLGEVAGLSERLNGAAGKLDALVERAMSSRMATEAIAQAADRLASRPASEQEAVASTMRDIANSTPARGGARPRTPPAKVTARKRRR